MSDEQSILIDRAQLRLVDETLRLIWLELGMPADPRAYAGPVVAAIATLLRGLEHARAEIVLLPLREYGADRT